MLVLQGMTGAIRKAEEIVASTPGVSNVACTGVLTSRQRCLTQQVTFQLAR